MLGIYIENNRVVPGGHVEVGESIETAVLREVEEEVGIQIRSCTDGKYKYKDCEVELIPLLFFESSFVKQESKLIRQTMIFFYTVKLPDDCEDIPVKMQVSEVKSYIWLPYEKIEKMIMSTNGKEEIIVFDSKAHGLSDKKTIKLERLFGPYPNEFGEGIAGGHKKSLQILLEILKSKHQ